VQGAANWPTEGGEPGEPSSELSAHGRPNFGDWAPLESGMVLSETTFDETGGIALMSSLSSDRRSGDPVAATSPEELGAQTMRRRFSVRPALTLRGRTFKGLRGWSGKPLHPPLTDFPIVAYVLAAAFDVISAIGGSSHGWAREFWHAGTFVFIGGA